MPLAHKKGLAYLVFVELWQCLLHWNGGGNQEGTMCLYHLISSLRGALRELRAVAERPQSSLNTFTYEPLGG